MTEKLLVHLLVDVRSQIVIFEKAFPDTPHSWESQQSHRNVPIRMLDIMSDLVNGWADKNMGFVIVRQYGWSFWRTT